MTNKFWGKKPRNDSKQLNPNKDIFPLPFIRLAISECLLRPLLDKDVEKQVPTE